MNVRVNAGYVPVMILKRVSGVTLLEGLLTMAIMSSILLLGVQQYQTYKNQTNALDLRYNVDKLFVAAAHYYQANCRSGTLAPPGNSVVTTALNGTGGIVGSYLIDWQPLNPLVDSAATDGGYSLQYNPTKLTRNRYVCFRGQQYPPGTNPVCWAPLPIQSGQKTVLNWQIQVAVKMAKPEYAKSYQGLTGADCVSDVATACNQAAAKPIYLIWQRTASYASPNMSSPLLPSTMRVTQFNAQYTHDELYEMNNATYASGQYYVCGGY